jgi:uncharacterized protein (TIGR02145 family)
MKKLFLAASVAMTVAGLTACGDETTNVTQTTGMTLVEKGAKMPDCTADNAGQMVYSTDSAAAFFCADGKWQSLKGEKGEQGIQGEQGPQGEPGEGKQGPKGEDGTGTKGDPGAAGKSCTAQKLTSGNGYKIVCGGDSVGVVMDGVGTNGTSCKIANDEDGAVTIQCGEGTNVTEAVLYKAVCGSEPYDPTKKFCDTRNNRLYKFVTIGTGAKSQIWMAENLNYKTPTGSACFENDAVKCAKYGRHYNWSTAISVCPAGWHLPSKAEFETLIENAKGSGSLEDASKALRAKTWDYTQACGNVAGNDTYEFTALPAGSISSDDTDDSFAEDEQTYFWSSTENDTDNATMMSIACSIWTEEWEKYYYFSVRCIKDAE